MSAGGPLEFNTVPPLFRSLRAKNPQTSCCSLYNPSYNLTSPRSCCNRPCYSTMVLYLRTQQPFPGSRCERLSACVVWAKHMSAEPSAMTPAVEAAVASYTLRTAACAARAVAQVSSFPDTAARKTPALGLCACSPATCPQGWCCTTQ